MIVSYYHINRPLTRGFDLQLVLSHKKCGNLALNQQNGYGPSQTWSRHHVDGAQHRVYTPSSSESHGFHWTWPWWKPSLYMINHIWWPWWIFFLIWSSHVGLLILESPSWGTKQCAAMGWRFRWQSRVSSSQNQVRRAQQQWAHLTHPFHTFFLGGLNS